MVIVVRIINFIFQALIIIIIVDSFLSFFVPPWNQIRQLLDRIVNPLLTPIRKIVPPIGGLDFSPLILLILIYILRSVIFSLLL